MKELINFLEIVPSRLFLEKAKPLPNTQVETEVSTKVTDPKNKLSTGKKEDVPPASVVNGNVPVDEPPPLDEVDPDTNFDRFGDDVSQNPEELDMGDEILDPVELGKIYMLKKLYAKLIALDKLLDRFNEDKYSILKSNVAEAIEIFNAVVLNYDLFKENIDSIIKLYQKFVLRAVSQLKVSDKESK